jgi:hypothetical protein
MRVFLSISRRTADGHRVHLIVKPDNRIKL